MGAYLDEGVASSSPVVRQSPVGEGALLQGGVTNHQATWQICKRGQMRNRGFGGKGRENVRQTQEKGLDSHTQVCTGD